MSAQNADTGRMDDTVPFFTGGLLSKWGFGDGDYLDDLLYDWEEEWGCRIDHHAVLIRVVREYVVPVLDQQVRVVEISSIHNPIRAETVDGQEVDHYGDNPFGLTPETVEVALSDIKRIARGTAHIDGSGVIK